MNDSQPKTPRRLYLPEDLTLRPATRADDEFLYQLLVERYENATSNIAQMAAGELPSFAQHVAHLDGRPYVRLDIVEVDGLAAGMMYLSRTNVGGSFVLRRYATRGVGLAACYCFFQTGPYPIIAHFNAHNRAGWRSAERLGFVRTETLPHRLTFELRGPPPDPFDALRRARSAR